MIDINKRLIAPIGYDAETVEEFIVETLEQSVQFYYKNISYLIDVWGGDVWAIQTNSYQNDCGVEWSIYKFNRTKESFITALEDFKLHDGTTLYDAITKKGYWKYFLYDKNAKY